MNLGTSFALATESSTVNESLKEDNFSLLGVLWETGDFIRFGDCNSTANQSPGINRGRLSHRRRGQGAAMPKTLLVTIITAVIRLGSGKTSLLPLG